MSVKGAKGKTGRVAVWVILALLISSGHLPTGADAFQLEADGQLWVAVLPPQDLPEAATWLAYTSAGAAPFALRAEIAELEEQARRARVIGNAQHLPFRSGSVDVVTSAHFFHHFTPQENQHILRESLRVARKGVAVNDTRRSYVPLLFVRLLGALRLVGRITRFDAPASVLRGYTVPEVREVAATAGATRSVVRRAFPWRFMMLLWK